MERAGAGPDSGRPACPARRSSTAWRKLTPSERITQSSTEPPAWHAPRQCHRFLAGLTTSDGSRSSWNGQRPTRSEPAFLSSTPEAATRASRATSFFSRSTSWSAIRALPPPAQLARPERAKAAETATRAVVNRSEDLLDQRRAQQRFVQALAGHIDHQVEAHDRRALALGAQVQPGPGAVSGGRGQGRQLFFRERMGVTGGLPVRGGDGGEGLPGPAPGVVGGQHQTDITAARQGHLQSQAPVGVGVGEGGFGAVYGQAQPELAGPGVGATGKVHWSSSSQRSSRGQLCRRLPEARLASRRDPRKKYRSYTWAQTYIHQIVSWCKEVGTGRQAG